MSEQDHDPDELVRRDGSTVSEGHVEEIREAARLAAQVVMMADVSPLELGLPDVWDDADELD